MAEQFLEKIISSFFFFSPNGTTTGTNYAGYYSIGEVDSAVLKPSVETTERITPFAAMNRRDRTFISKSSMDLEITTAQIDRYLLGLLFNLDLGRLEQEGEALPDQTHELNSLVYSESGNSGGSNGTKFRLTSGAVNVGDISGTGNDLQTVALYRVGTGSSLTLIPVGSNGYTLNKTAGTITFDSGFTHTNTEIVGTITTGSGNNQVVDPIVPFNTGASISTSAINLQKGNLFRAVNRVDLTDATDSNTELTAGSDGGGDHQYLLGSNNDVGTLKFTAAYNDDLSTNALQLITGRIVGREQIVDINFDRARDQQRWFPIRVDRGGGTANIHVQNVTGIYVRNGTTDLEEGRDYELDRRNGLVRFLLDENATIENQTNGGVDFTDSDVSSTGTVTNVRPGYAGDWITGVAHSGVGMFVGYGQRPNTLDRNDHLPEFIWSGFDCDLRVSSASELSASTIETLTLTVSTRANKGWMRVML